jgi:hypothetical protein
VLHTSRRASDGAEIALRYLVDRRPHAASSVNKLLFTDVSEKPAASRFDLEGGYQVSANLLPPFSLQAIANVSEKIGGRGGGSRKWLPN